MVKKKTKFTKEFRLEAIKLVTERGYTQAEAAKNLGISSKNLSRWIAAESSRKVIKARTRISEEQKELEELRKENKRLKLEREILKKAAAFFANEKN